MLKKTFIYMITIFLFIWFILILLLLVKKGLLEKEKNN